MNYILFDRISDITSERGLNIQLSDKFSIDDILAEFGEEKNEKNAQKPQ